MEKYGTQGFFHRQAATTIEELKSFTELTEDYARMSAFTWAWSVQQRDFEIKMIYAKLEPWGA